MKHLYIYIYKDYIDLTYVNYVWQHNGMDNPTLNDKRALFAVFLDPADYSEEAIEAWQNQDIWRDDEKEAAKKTQAIKEKQKRTKNCKKRKINTL